MAAAAAASRPMSTLSTLPRLPIFEAIKKHDGRKTAIVHSGSRLAFTYGQLAHDVVAARDSLQHNIMSDGKRLEGARISFLMDNGYDYVVTLLSILAAHALAVPLSPSFSVHESRYMIQQSQSSILLSSPPYHAQAEAILGDGIHTSSLVVHHKHGERGNGTAKQQDWTLTPPESDQGGVLLYTSGTTSRPKGVVLPQKVLTAQSLSLLEAWAYSDKDVLLHILPLHHIHGLVNALLTPLFAGSEIEFLYPFHADAVWNRLAAPFLAHQTSTSQPMMTAHQNPTNQPITIMTAVPTIYTRLLSAASALSPHQLLAAQRALHPSHMRLNMAGSAALPRSTQTAWTSFSNGNVLLERYGMTEVGMALSCGLHFADRVDGSVGWPLPSVEVRLVDTETGAVMEEGEEQDQPPPGRERLGEIHVRGPTVFREYWNNPEATAKDFVDGGDGGAQWFKTGDMAVRRHVEGTGKSGQAWATGPLYFIQGRASADIIKTGGEKVSALEVEREMLCLSQVSEVAVVGVKSETWGEKVAAIVVLTKQGMTAGKGGKQWTTLDMRRSLKPVLASYKIPREMRIVESIARNAMGKINKRALAQQYWGPTPGDEKKDERTV